ncbi:MAG: type I methionyl aminopeptidase [Candidatus Omnitrophota bacterium]
MIQLKSQREIAAIRKASEIVALTLRKLSNSVKAGITTLELDAMAAALIEKSGGRSAFKGYRGYPANICTSINEEVVHGIPSNRALKDGDIISIDVGVEIDGYFGDGAVTVGVGKISKDAANIVSVTEKALMEGIKAAYPGNRIFDISNSIQRFVEEAGYTVVRAFVGHGIGSKIHEEPEIPNFGRPGTGPKIEQGMVLAIEPMVNAGTYEVEVAADGWTAITKDKMISAHFEHTVLINNSQAEVLTK